MPVSFPLFRPRRRSGPFLFSLPLVRAQRWFWLSSSSSPVYCPSRSTASTGTFYHACRLPRCPRSSASTALFCGGRPSTTLPANLEAWRPFVAWLLARIGKRLAATVVAAVVVLGVLPLPSTPEPRAVVLLGLLPHVATASAVQLLTAVGRVTNARLLESVARPVLTLILVVVALQHGAVGAVGVFAAHAVALAVAAATSCWFLRRTLRVNRASLAAAGCSPAQAASWKHTSRHTGLAATSWLLFTEVEIIVVGLLGNTSMVAVVSLAHRLATGILLAQVALCPIVARAVAASMADQQPVARAAPLLAELSRWSLHWSLVAALLGTPLAFVLVRFLGADYADLPVLFLCLCPGYLLSARFGFAGPTLQMASAERTEAAVIAVGVVAKATVIPLLLVTVGLMPAAAASGASLAAVCIVNTWLVRKRFGIVV